MREQMAFSYSIARKERKFDAYSSVALLILLLILLITL
jgi:hypothetical protein